MNPSSKTYSDDTFDMYFPNVNFDQPRYCPTVDDLVAMYNTNLTDFATNNPYEGWNQLLFQFPPVDNRRQTPAFHDFNADRDASNLFQNTQQFNVNTNQSIEYEPIPSPDFRFGDVEIDLYMSDVRACPPTAIDISPGSPILQIKKPVKVKRLSKNSKAEQAKQTFMNINEDWDVIDPATGRKRHPFLHEFLRQILDNKNYSHIVDYVDKRKGIFKFYRRQDAAALWQLAKARNTESTMTYDKLARALRYYYTSKIICRTPGRYTFKFGEGSGFGENWIPS